MCPRLRGHSESPPQMLMYLGKKNGVVKKKKKIGDLTVDPSYTHGASSTYK